ncbi:MAG: hypothetical protein HOP13_11040 [Alphaproteobacteria bacterium]|nr:hypothetical protein [Alphaproteobacteria bacterium]
MLAVLFLVSAAVLAAGWLRFKRPLALWQKALMGGAALLLAATLVALGIEAMMQVPVA